MPLNPHLDALDFVALDFETGNYARESAVSLGLAKFCAGEVVDTWYSLIRPPKLYIRPDFTAIHGLTVEDVRGAPVFSDLWGSAVVPFVGGLPLVAHNAAFDMGVLRALFDSYGIAPPPMKYFCSLKIARKTWPEFPSRALTALAEQFGIVYDAHNALADARTCGDIVYRAAAKWGCTTLRTLFQRTGQSFTLL
jgi:DNA polymerase-3 subunit epsilon